MEESIDSDVEMELPNGADAWWNPASHVDYVHHPPGRRGGLRGVCAARLAAHPDTISAKTRRIARWPAICSFALGMAGPSPTTYLPPNGPVRNGKPRVHGK
jgi:hypothetical protein